jgi:Protein of unknown function (DUF3500)
VSAYRDVALRMADAVSALLATFTPQQRSAAHWEFPSDDERRQWFYAPTDHGGLTLAEMRPVQQRLTMKLLATGLSEAAYVTASTIMGLENVLDRTEGFRVEYGFERGRDPARYYLRIFGTPGADNWSWRFGGHHISIHHTVVGGELRAFTPCFFGADPARSPLLGAQMLRPLAACEDLAFELLHSLSDEQKSVALLSPVPPLDLVGANRALLAEGDGPKRLNHIWRNEFTGELHDMFERFQDAEEAKIGLTAQHVDALRYTKLPRGLAAAAMNASQQEMLRALLTVYVNRLPEAIADQELAKVSGDAFEHLHLAWAGGDDPKRPHYYRIHGQRLLVEYDNTARQVNHVHTVWRDPVNDFGMDALSAHHKHDHDGHGHAHDHSDGRDHGHTHDHKH